MTSDEVFSRVRSITGETDESLVRSYVEQAGQMVLERRYPFAPDSDIATASVPERYRQVQARLAVTLWAKRGAEGEAAHSENGVSRTYEDEDKILSEVIPYVGFGGIR